MGDVKLVHVDDLRPGDRLGQDIMAGNQVLLRSGTELNDGHIQRIQRLPTQRVAIQLASPLPAAEAGAPGEVVQLPVFRDLAKGDEVSWMADEYFSRPVAAPVHITPTEQLFATVKNELRRKVGLTPMVDQVLDSRIRKEIHAAFIASVLKNEVNLNLLGDAAQALVSAMGENPDGYLAFEDVAQYGQHLAATAMLSSQVFNRARPEAVNGDISDHVRCQFALTNAQALLPFRMAGACESQPDNEVRERIREALLRYYAWLRSRRFVTEQTLELVLMQYERYDGHGLPYGLSGAMVPPESEAWSVATAFSQRVFSQPKQPRATSREAADQLIGQSGRAFSARGVNRLLTSVGYFPTGALVELSSDKLALVLRQNERALLKPVVQLVNPDGTAAEAFDLLQSPDVFIRRQVLEY